LSLYSNGHIVTEARPGPQLQRRRNLPQRATIAAEVSAVPIPGIRFRVDFGPDEAVGPGKIELLEQIASGGSLSQAARTLNMSYRRAWQLLESLNGTFREPVAVTSTGGRGGGGAAVTAFGQRLVRIYRQFDAEMQARAAQRFRPLLEQARRRAAGAGSPRRAAAPVRRLSGR
jgi:molybdate transport system regulatory protein